MAKQDLRVVKTNRQIDQALLRLLGQMPFCKIKVEQLCREAMINRSTFYTYYQDKYDLMDKYLGRVMGEFEAQVDVAFVTASPQRVGDPAYRQSFDKVLRLMAQHREEYLALWGLSLSRSVFGEMVDIVGRNILAQLDTRAMDPSQRVYAQLYARLFASDMMTLVRWWLEHEDIQMEQVQKIMADNMSQGMFQTFRKYVGG